MFLKRLHFILPEKQQLANNWVEGGGVGQKLGKGNCPSQVDTLYATTLVRRWLCVKTNQKTELEPALQK